MLPTTREIYPCTARSAGVLVVLGDSDILIRRVHHNLAAGLFRGWPPAAGLFVGLILADRHVPGALEDAGLVAVVMVMALTLALYLRCGVEVSASRVIIQNPLRRYELDSATIDRTSVIHLWNSANGLRIELRDGRKIKAIALSAGDAQALGRFGNERD